MAHINKDPRNGNWLARWRDPSGRSRSKSFPRKVDAERFLSQLTAELHRGAYIDPAAGRITTGTFAQTWADGMAHLKPSTAERYRGIVRIHIVTHWGKWPLASITHSDVAAWIADLHRSGLSAGSIRQIHRVLSLVLDTAVKDGRISRNAAAGVSLPRQIRAEPHFLTAAEVADLCRTAGADWLPIAVLVFTGLRFGELTALRVRRLDVERRPLLITESASEVAGRLIWSTTKTHKARSVPVPPFLMPHLVKACRGRTPDDTVFTAPGGGPLRLRNWRTRVFDPSCRAVGLVDITPHDLRHTAASLAIGAGANVKAVQRMLGHASAAMTLDIYAGLFPDDLDNVAASLEPLRVTLRYICGTTTATTPMMTTRARRYSPPDLRFCMVGPVGLEPTTYGVPVRRAAVRTLGRLACLVAAAWLWLFGTRKRLPCPARCPFWLHARRGVQEPRVDPWQHSIGSGDCGRGVCGGRPIVGQTSRHRRSLRVAHPCFGTARKSHRADSGAGEPAGVVGSRVAGGHHGVTRSALDASRRRAESGAKGRRLQGDLSACGISPWLLAGLSYGAVMPIDSRGAVCIWCGKRCFESPDGGSFLFLAKRGAGFEMSRPSDGWLDGSEHLEGHQFFCHAECFKRSVPEAQQYGLRLALDEVD